METQSIIGAFQGKARDAATAVFVDKKRSTYGKLSRLADAVAAGLPEGCRRICIVKWIIPWR